MADIRAELALARLCHTRQDAMLQPLRELLRAERSMTYRIVDEDDRTRLELLEFAGYEPSREAVTAMVSLLSQGRTTQSYRPSNVEPWQRNVAVRLREHVPADVYSQYTTVSKLYPKFGLRGSHELRVLACDGPVMLAWIGGFSPDRFGVREERMLQALAPALRRWMMWRVRMGHLAEAGGALPAALEAIASAAFLLDRTGRPLLANQAARQLLARDRASTISVLQRCAREAGSNERFAVTEAHAPGFPRQFLAVERAASDVSERVTRARLVWKLTQRQTEVLSLLAQGHANRTIAEWLGCGERTVEVHVTNLLDKAGVDSRAALVARLWMGI